MKTNRIILLLMIAVTVSCSKENLRIQTQGGPIDFVATFSQNNPEENLQMRGIAIDNQSDVANKGGFNVWGYRHAGYWPTVAKTLLFNNVTVTSADNGTTWNYGSPIDWPMGQNVSFFAYAPANSAALNGYDTDGVPEIDFTVNNTPANQVDLLIASQMLDRIGPNPVPVKFDHALARVRFSALKSSTADAINIKSIELKNIYFKGTTSVQTPVVWVLNTSATQNYLLTTLNGGLSNVNLTSTEQPLSTSAGMLFLMPQTLNSSQLVVKFTVGTLNYELSFTNDNFSPNEVWLPGQAYTYQLFFDGTTVVVKLCGDLESTTPDTWGNY